MESGQTREVWRSEAPYYERIVTILDEDAEKLLTMRESLEDQPNYFVRDLRTQSLDQITDFEHPTPELRDVTKEFIQYERSDGVQLSATLYLPAGYDVEKDGKLPVLVRSEERRVGRQCGGP